MSIRVRETHGTSWKGTSPGTRHWHSTSVTYGFSTSLALCFTRGLWGLFLLPFVIMWWMLMAELWVLAEFALVIVTGTAVIAAVAHREARAADITLTRARWGLFLVGMKGSLR